MPSGLKIVSKMDTIIYKSARIAGVDVPDNNDDNTSVDNTNNNTDEIHDDEMHPDDIAGLAPTRQQDNKVEIVDGQQDQTDDNEEIKIIFEPDKEATDNEEDPEEEKDSEEDDEPDHPEFDRLIQTRSGQVSRPVHKYVTTHQGQGHLNTQTNDTVEYSTETAKVIARTINAMNHQFAQTYSLSKGIKTFGKKGRQAAHKEMKQLHD
jgi:hypothetical protein